MRKALRRFLDWLDTRFPAKVVVTEESYRALLEREAKRDAIALNLRADLAMLAKRFDQSEDAGGAYEVNTRQITKLHEERLDKAETAIAAIKDLLAKGGVTAIAKEQNRAAFIAEGRFPA